jgi:predicted Fe-Mo cluster-binding NifX family protein
MKIAISSNGSTLDSEVDPRFGRCQQFIVVDPETMAFEVVDNTSAAMASGAGISAAKTITDKGVKSVLTGNCGPNAFEVLSSAGIDIITGVSGKVKSIIEDYQSGKYRASFQASVPGHFGSRSMGGGQSNFGFREKARRDTDRGRRKVGDIPITSGTAPRDYRESIPRDLEQRLQDLKVQSQSMAVQLAEIKRRISKLEAERE